MSEVRVVRRAQAAFTDDYGCAFQRILPWGASTSSDDGVGLAVVPPGGSTAPHAHDEQECFFLVRGRARLHVGEQATILAAGDAALVAARALHRIENLSAEDRLEVLCIWFPPAEALA